jgi:electron transfer flavoprotein alpha subunit
MVLVYAEINKNRVKKSSLECIHYASKIASLTGTEVCVLVNQASPENTAELGKAGAQKVLSANDESFNKDSSYVTAAMEQAAKQVNAKVIVFAFDVVGKAVAPRLSAKLRAGLVAGATEVPVIGDTGFEVKKNVFSGKANAVYTIHSETKIISLLPNSLPVVMGENKATVESFSPDFSAVKNRIVVKETKSTATGGMIPLPEAELVVSAGRGMKGPENWGMIEDLAGSLGATTACSRPVADLHWRPHHEHVGQTGIAIRPNLYIAIGISGAIQHLAGVNGSKTIVVINNDKEAPFFKSADYGIIGDAFTVVPKLTEAVKKFKAHQN